MRTSDAAGNQIPEVSIVIPVYNEAEVIGEVLSAVIRETKSMAHSCEVIVVNDRSTDGTRQIVERFSNKDGVILIDSKNPRGKGGALRSGFDAARGMCIVMMDGDGSHQACDIPRLVEEQRRTNGLVIGSRIYGGSQEYTRLRAFGNIFFTWLFGLFHGRYLSDALNGFKAFGSSIYREFWYSSNGFEIEIELLVNTLQSHRPITEVPSMELKRQGSEVKSNVVRDGFRFLYRIIYEKFRTRKPREVPPGASGSTRLKLGAPNFNRRSPQC
jgi:glycosyltransferase involved in cell wall biosynthesis